MNQDRIAKALGAAAQISISDDSLVLRQKGGEKWAERRACGCCWVYLAKQPLVAPCDEHLARLEDDDGE